MSANEAVKPMLVATRAGFDELIDVVAGKPARQRAEWIETGLEELDFVLGGGLKLGEVSIWAAYTGGGKSAVADQIALNAAKQHGTYYYSYELGRRRTTDRLLAKIMRTTETAARNLLAQDPPPPVVVDAVKKLFDEYQLKVDEIVPDQPNTLTFCLSLAIDANAKLLIIDDLSYLEDWSARGARSDYPMRDVMRRLSDAAKTLNAHIMCVHQLKSRIDSKDGRPQIGDLADAHHVAKIADAIVMLHRPFRGAGILKDRIVEMLVRKNRSGPEVPVHVEWHGPTMSYRTLLPQDQENLECCQPKGRARRVVAASALPVVHDAAPSVLRFAPPTEPEPPDDPSLLFPTP